MVNANGISPYAYAMGINDIINEAKGSSYVDAQADKETLSDYVGNYSEQPWYAETYMGTWYGKLVCMDLPADDPVGNMTFLEFVDKDTFRRVRDNGELGEVIIFQRDEKGDVVSYQWFQNFSKKIK